MTHRSNHVLFTLFCLLFWWAGWPYAVGQPVKPTVWSMFNHIIGLYPWLFAHPVRLLAALPLLLWILRLVLVHPVRFNHWGEVPTDE